MSDHNGRTTGETLEAIYGLLDELRDLQRQRGLLLRTAIDSAPPPLTDDNPTSERSP